MSVFDISIVTVTPFQQNCAIVACPEKKKCVVIDPGGDIDLILAEIKKRDLKVEKIWITHGHLDHGGAAKALKAATGARIEGPHKTDEFWIADIPKNAVSCGMKNMDSFVPDRWLNDGDTVTLCDKVWQVIHCPGHTPGSVVFYSKDVNMAFVGDVLFCNSIGRADLPGSDPQELIRSITQKLWPLGDDVLFIPGHGTSSTFGAERKNNPFVADRRLQAF